MSIDIKEQYDKIYRFCYYKVGNHVIAEDLTQETFLKYFAQTSYLEHGKKLAYLYTIARNLCIDHYRRRREETLSEEAPDADHFGQVELSIALRQALKILPVAEQELLLFRYANELSVREISSIMGISRFTVYRKMNSAVGTLKKILREEDFL